MPKKSRRSSGAERFLAAGEGLRALFPHLYSVIVDEEDFIELRVKARLDGTTLIIVKRYDSDGGPVVCFGVGYGVVGSLLAIDASIQGDNWKVDKPYPGKAGQS